MEKFLKGMTVSEIGREMTVGIAVIEMHLAGAARKLHIEDRYPRPFWARITSFSPGVVAAAREALRVALAEADETMGPQL